MVTLEFRYVFYITELQKKNFWIRLFRNRYKRKLIKRYELLQKQHQNNEIGDKEFDIYKRMILKVI